jgi:omega-6 fatty acid desaturase (delta-12 desaturase)
MASSTAATTNDPSDWIRAVGKYRTPAWSRSVLEIAVSVLPFALCWWALYWSLQHGHVWLYALLLLPTTGFLVRMFLIQHDCGHQAFFASRRANDWVGRTMGVFTITAYEHWRRAHAIHHATSGNLSKRGVGDIDTLTVAEYRARTPAARWRYRLYRNPLIMFGIGPAFVFILQNRIPAGFLRGGWRPWLSTLGTDLFLAILVGTLVYFIGWRAFLAVHVPIMMLSATIGGWLFYVQHQFEHTSWDNKQQWSVRTAALNGSSHYDLPPVLRWFTANIGVHHVHHLCSRIPFYRLPAVLREYPSLRERGRLTLWQSFRCVRLTLWDEESRRLISFRDFDRAQARNAVRDATRVPVAASASDSTAMNASGSSGEATSAVAFSEAS